MLSLLGASVTGWDRIGSFRAVPSTVRNPVTMFDVLDVTGGTQHTCARLEDTTARCWGDDALGQVGDGVVGDNLSPTLVQGFGA